MVGALASDSNSIYYNTGYKSYKIIRLAGEESWYKWMEYNRYLMRKVKISIKVIKWLVSIFIEASKIRGNVIKRWSLKDHFEEFYGTLKYNEKWQIHQLHCHTGGKRIDHHHTGILEQGGME